MTRPERVICDTTMAGSGPHAVRGDDIEMNNGSDDAVARPGPGTVRDTGGVIADIAQELDALLADLDRARVDRADQIASVAAPHRAAAENLVDYATVRRHDLRELQSRLLDAGISPLIGCEVDVQASLRAARAAVAALAGQDPSVHADPESTGRARRVGDEELAAAAERLLGRGVPDRAGRVMVTMPSEAADDPELVIGLAERGMELARINCAHDDRERWARMIAHVRLAEERVGRAIPVSMDLAGPKLRSGPIALGEAVGRARVTRDADGSVIEPAHLWMTPDDVDPEHTQPAPAVAGRPALSVRVDRQWLRRRKVGQEIDVPDARRVTRTFTVVRVEEGGVLAEGSRNAYVREGSRLSCEYDRTRLHGIPQVPRRIRLRRGDTLVLTTDMTPVVPPTDGSEIRLGCALPEAVAALRVGDPVLFDDGVIAGEVRRVSAEGDPDGPWARVEVVRCRADGRWLGSEKGINLPETGVQVPALTEEDRHALHFAAEHADVVALSFVRSPQDVVEAVEAIEDAGRQVGRTPGLLVKIETGDGYRALPQILLAAMRHDRAGVMIARGDLAVEMGFESLSEIPRNILLMSQAARLPVVLATQVLESLAKTGLPSRAEISDAGSAQRAECVMLNKGPYIGEAIDALVAINARMEAVQRKSLPLLRHVRSWD